MNVSPDQALEQIATGAAKILSPKALHEKLSLGRPLRVKLGVDPTAPDIHFGHTVALEKLRQFQQLGHQAVLIIGDFTATIGDPTGRSATRPPLTRDQVLENAKTYIDQAFKVLDRQQTEIVYNGDWFRTMKYEDILQLNSRVTLQQMLQREDFKNRIEQGQEVRLHELQYPIMQGWDSVEVKADVEIGGTDQLFNILVGRDMQKDQGMPQQVALMVPLLEGTDGVKKMSKSYGNYIGVSEPAPQMFGKIMSISDELMKRYYELLLGEDCPANCHPMEAKKSLAERLTARFHNKETANHARQDWETRFSKKDLSAAELPEFSMASLPANTSLLSLVASVYQHSFQLEKSNSEIKKQLIATGAIQLDGEKLTDPQMTPALAPNQILRLSKKHSVKLIQ